YKEKDQTTKPSPKEEPKQPAVTDEEDPKTEVKAPEPEKIEPPAKEEPVTYGDKNKTRLTILAEKESWVLITDAKGNTIFDRTLKQGEIYNVPMGSGLKLTTGNAKGLLFSLDGMGLPKLKTASPVVRAMSLDPEKVKARLTKSDSEH
ncbi:MAG: DUF4115 domain-containing protein, partial [Bdellovibrionales bacterium]